MKAVIILALLAVSAVSGNEVSEALKTSLIAQMSDPVNACGAGSYSLSGLTKPAGGGNQDYRCVQPACPDKEYDYYMNVCAPSTSGPDCSPKGYGICQYGVGSFNLVASLGTWQNAVWTAPQAGQVVATMTDGDICYIGQEVPRTARVVFQCGGSTSQAMTVVEDKSTCVFTITLAANCNSGGGGGGGGSDSMSGGTVFIIILLVVIPVYIVGGCVYKTKAKGTSGIESCPNVDFWRSLPGLVKDGFRFLFSKCGGGGGGGYSQV